MQGYSNFYGYYGRLPDGTWRLFATEEEYKEIFKEFYKKMLTE